MQFEQDGADSQNVQVDDEELTHRLTQMANQYEESVVANNIVALDQQTNTNQHSHINRGVEETFVARENRLTDINVINSSDLSSSSRISEQQELSFIGNDDFFLTGPENQNVQVVDETEDGAEY